MTDEDLGGARHIGGRPAYAPCHRCQTTEADAFSSPTSAFCASCWEWMTDHGRRFGEWLDDTTDAARGRWRVGPWPPR